MPACVGAFCCSSFAFAIISANDPFGGGFEDTGAAFCDADDVDIVLFIAGLAAGVEVGRGLGAAAAAIGLESGCLIDVWVRGF